jgi:lipopolysaccharide transport protein LptA
MDWQSISKFLLTLLVSTCICGQAAAQSASPSPAPTSSKKNIFDPKAFGAKSDKEPTFVDSDSLTLNTLTRVFTYSGHVIVRHGDLTLTADTIDGDYTEKNEIRTITAHGNVVITRPPSMKATGQKAIYDAQQATIVLTESPTIEQEGSSLSADQIKIYLKDNRSEALGQVHVRLLKKTEKEKKAEVKAKQAAASLSPSPTPSRTPSPSPSPKKRRGRK